MDPNQQQLLLSYGGKKSTYIEDLFSTYLYKGTQSTKTINNGIDLAGEGGMTWIKDRDASEHHGIYDTVRGATKYLTADTAVGEATDTNALTAFNNNGFSLGTGNSQNVVNKNNQSFASWSFRKQEGFFDLVTYTGTGSVLNIAHDLGTVPGCIIIKKTSGTDNWSVYHRGLDEHNPENWWVGLNITNARLATGGTTWNNTKPTATQFTVGAGDQNVNSNGATYVAYIFAGGETGYNSVEFDGINDYLKLPASGDFNFGTGDFTAECWFNRKVAGSHSILCLGNSNTSGTFDLYLNSSGGITFYVDGSSRVTTSSPQYGLNEWCHLAIVRSSNYIKVYLDGTAIGSAYNTTGNTGSGHHLYVGKELYNNIDSNFMNGYISNLRVVKGQALYTSNFTPSTTPLTLTSQGITPGMNVATLCCNGDYPSFATTDNDPPEPKPNDTTDCQDGGISPFTSPSSLFGEDGDKAVIRCGSYLGNGYSNNLKPVINLGWEPQWLLTKRVTGGSANWQLYDSMRGIASEGGLSSSNPMAGANDCVLHTDMSNADNCIQDWIQLTPRGFEVTTTNAVVNNNGDRYIYMAIRRPDPLVGKPAEAGTDVFAMDTGNGSATIPAFDSGFPVDFGLTRKPASSNEWNTHARLLGGNHLVADANGGLSNSNWTKWNSNVGEGVSWSSLYQSWMWKRGAGFDVVTYMGNAVTTGRQIPHNLARTPEMIWAKRMDPGTSINWSVYHKGLNGGTNPQNYDIQLNTDAAENGGEVWKYTAPTSTVVTVSHDSRVNANNGEYIMFLFASVAGISKCGYYTGTGSTLTIEVGFEPRLVIIKKTSSATNANWVMFDSLRGLGTGNDPTLELDLPNGQDNTNVMDKTSTGFTILNDFAKGNENGARFIYYAHA